MSLGRRGAPVFGRALIFGCALLLSGPARAAAPDSTTTAPIVDLTLSNGLRVVLSAMPHQPLAFAGDCAAAGDAGLDALAACLADPARAGDRLVVIAGDFTPAELRARVEEKLGKLPARPRVEWRAPERESRALVWTSAAPGFEIAYRVTPAAPLDGYALLVAGALLGPRARVVFASSRVELVLDAPPDGYERAEQELEKLRREPISQTDLARAREALRPVESAGWRAARLFEWTAAFGNPRLARDLASGVAALAPADLQRALARLLVRPRRSVTELRPRPGPALPTERGAPKVPPP